MIHEKDKVSQLKLAYIGGGSRDWAWCFMRDLALEAQMEGEIRLYDIDPEAARQNQVIGMLHSNHPAALSHWQYRAVDSLKEALTGADFVVISILPGTFDEMESDVHAPEKYGIYQSVGDTVGPGGAIRALRTIPMYRVIAEAIRDYAPQAWVINYTNPMSVCVKTLYEVFPQIKAFGCCHEVFHAQDLMVCMLHDNGYADAARKQITTTVTGVNHFTWFTQATWRGMDLFPMFKEFALKYAESGYAQPNVKDWHDTPFQCMHRVLFDLFLRYGYVAAANDRHLSEFLPNWYLKSGPETEKWKFSLTPVSWRKEDLKDRLAHSAAMRDGSEEIDLKPSGEEGHLMMKALLGLGNFVSNVNLPNRGQVPNLPLGAVVETNAVFSPNGVKPIYAGPVPQDIVGFIMPHTLNQQSLVTAALTGNKELAFHAFVNEPIAHFNTLNDARELFETMLHNTAAYLPREFQ